MKRTLEQALANADRCRRELPELILPGLTEIDLIVLADEVIRLQRDIDIAEEDQRNEW